MNQKKILISGYYGFDNFGDDAILHVLISDVKNSTNNPKITVISDNPEKTKLKYNVESVYRFDFKNIFSCMKSSDLFISGGGSLLQDITSFKSLLYYLGLILLALILGVKSCIYAQGIGPIKSKFGRFLTSILLKKLVFIAVRDTESQNFLKKLGVKSVLTADPVWRLECDEIKYDLDASKEKIKVGIQLRSWHSLDDKNLKNLAEAINTSFSSENYQLILISLQDVQDLDVTKHFEKVMKQVNKSFETSIISNLSICEVSDLISQLNFFIAMRFHANLISIKFNIPTLAISYDPKVESLSTDAQIPYISVDNINLTELREKLQELINNKDTFTDKLKNFSEKKQRESRQNLELLSKILM
ncbi:MAG: polysaccharide pyruvyl transferase CsaB [Candidatus Gastranaerophilales bacterium]|nr:polysaccharide pyruvyl transferase CsaB [Candidatus Gastranaerophilales bacterium]